MEASIFDMDPWFRPKPRKQESERLAEANAALIEWQLHQDKFRDLIPSLLEDLWTYQVCACKTAWERKSLERVQRTIETSNKGNTIETKIRRKLVDEVIFDGPMTRQINPYWFFIDPRVTKVRDAAFVGDQSEWMYQDLERYQKLGLFLNVDELKDDKSDAVPIGRDQGMADFLRQAQTPTNRYFGIMQNVATKGARKIRITELWCLFDLYDDGVAHECVLTVADNHTCLRAMKNPFDRKRRPYHVARAARGGHGFFGVGPMDNAVRLQIDFDSFASTVKRVARLTANPITFVEKDADIPNSLYLLQEGEILKGVGNVTMTKMPDTLGMAGFMFAFYERKIAETTGIPKILEATPTNGGTATEVMRLTQEGNRRIAGLQRRFGELLQDVLEFRQELNVQFITEKVEFPVLGRRAQDAGIGRYAELDPETLLSDVDYEIVGINSMSSFGTKAMAMQNFVTGNMPLLAVDPNFDRTTFLHERLSADVGQEIADRIIKIPKALEEFRTQKEEDVDLRYGFVVQVDPEDDDKEHLSDPDFRALIKQAQAGKLPLRVTKAVMRHMLDHQQQLERKKIQATITQGRQDKQQAMMPQQGEDDGVGSPPPGGQESLPGQKQGQNPGPPDMQKMGRAGRAGPTSQGTDAA